MTLADNIAILVPADTIKQYEATFMRKNSIQTNINLTREDHEKLIAMMDADGYVTKSPFVRWLIREEFDRRTGGENTAIAKANFEIAEETQAN